MSISSIASLWTAPVSKITSIVTVWQTTQSSKNCWLQGLIQLLFAAFHSFPPPWLLSYFFLTVVKSPTNYVLSKLHRAVEFVSRLMYLKTSRVSQTVGVGTPVPLHPVPVLALIHAFPLFFWALFTLYRCTARIGTDCCTVYALMFFLLLLRENKSAPKGVFSFWENFSVMQWLVCWGPWTLKNVTKITRCQLGFAGSCSDSYLEEMEKPRASFHAGMGSTVCKYQGRHLHADLLRSLCTYGILLHII